MLTNQSNQISILIAEDSEVNLDLLNMVFEQEGYHPTLCADGLSAYEEFKNNFYALVILDIGLPGLDGLTLCSKIRKLPKGNQCFILIYTSYSDAEKLNAALEAGADDFLNKSTSPSQFSLRIKIAIRTVRSQMEKYQAAISIRESERKVRAIIDASPDIVVMIDKAGEILDANRMLCNVLNAKRSSIMGKNIFSLFPENVAKARKSVLDQVLSAKKAFQYFDSNDNIHYKHNIYPIFNVNNQIEKVVIYSTDITRQC